MLRRRRWLAILLAAGLILVVASGSYSGMEADRLVAVDVAEDRNAYLGIQDFTPIKISDEVSADVEIIMLYNQLHTALDQISVSSDTDSLSIVDEPDDLGVGESDILTADIECEEEGNDINAVIQIQAIGSGVSVSTSEMVVIECEETESDDEDDDESNEGEDEESEGDDEDEDGDEDSEEGEDDDSEEEDEDEEGDEDNEEGEDDESDEGEDEESEEGDDDSEEDEDEDSEDDDSDEAEEDD